MKYDSMSCEELSAELLKVKKLIEEKKMNLIISLLDCLRIKLPSLLFSALLWPRQCSSYYLLIRKTILDQN